jgi:hypothetical protein
LIKIYPNPAMDILNIEIENLKAYFTINIRSETDQIIISKPILHNSIKMIEQLDLSGYPSGSYFCEIINEKNDIVKKILLHK